MSRFRRYSSSQPFLEMLVTAPVIVIIGEARSHCVTFDTRLLRDRYLGEYTLRKHGKIVQMLAQQRSAQTTKVSALLTQLLSRVQ